MSFFPESNQQQSAIDVLLQRPNKQTEGKTGKTKRFTVIVGDWLHHLASLPIATMAHGPSALACNFISFSADRSKNCTHEDDKEQQRCSQIFFGFNGFTWMLKKMSHETTIQYR